MCRIISYWNTVNRNTCHAITNKNKNLMKKNPDKQLIKMLLIFEFIQDYFGSYELIQVYLGSFQLM